MRDGRSDGKEAEPDLSSANVVALSALGASAFKPPRAVGKCNVPARQSARRGKKHTDAEN